MVDSYLGNRLFRLPPSVQSDPTVRRIIVTREVLDAVDINFPDNYDGIRLSNLRETLDAFTIGERISVGENPFKKPSNCFLARVDPVALEVFDIRSLVGPGIRCFGFFLDKNYFAALTWDYRENIESFSGEAKRCAHEWGQMFGSLEPFSKGKRVDEYLTRFQAF